MRTWTLTITSADGAVIRHDEFPHATDMRRALVDFAGNHQRINWGTPDYFNNESGTVAVGNATYAYSVRDSG